MNTAARPECVLAEWTEAYLPGLQLSTRDRRLVAELAEQRRLTVTESREGVSVKARGWVGVVFLEACVIRVEPRLIEGHRNLVRLLEYVHGLQLLKWYPPEATFEAEGNSLFDLLALLLARACDEVLQRGVQADYLPQHDELTVLRGRLDVKAQVLQRWGRLDRLVCDFEDRVRDIPENQWLLRALRVARKGVRSPAAATEVRRVASAWEELCQDDGIAPVQRPEITRTNHHYRHALALAYLMVEGVTASDLLGSGVIRGFSFMLSMPRLFEEFVVRVLRDTLGPEGVQIHPQKSDRSILWDPDAGKPFGSLRPDVLLSDRTAACQLPVDAKYKGYDGEPLQPGDLYQAAIYALAMARSTTAGGPKFCVLLYPSTDTAPRVQQRVQVRTDGAGTAEVVIAGINVPRLLGQLEAGSGLRLAADAGVAALKRVIERQAAGSRLG